MNKLSIFCIISVVFAFTLSACGIDPAEKFNGRWEILYVSALGRTFPYNEEDSFVNLDFQKDGTYTLQNGDKTETGHYYIDDNGDVILIFDVVSSENQKVLVSMDENSMVWTYNDAENDVQISMYFSRASTSS